MSWLWNWLFVNRKAMMLQAEINHLRTEIAESLRRQDEWRATSEAAGRERDLERANSERMISTEREQHASAVMELNQSIQRLEINLAESQKRAQDVERTNRSLNDQVRFRDQQITEIHSTSADEISCRDSRIQILELRLAELQSELTAAISVHTSQRTDFTHQLGVANQRHQADVAGLQSRIHELESSLAASEAHSESRAEQRSSLLRNLAEIHRLSSLITRDEPATGSLKRIQPDPETSASLDAENGSFKTGDAVLESLPWTIFGDVESA